MGTHAVFAFLFVFSLCKPFCSSFCFPLSSCQNPGKPFGDKHRITTAAFKDKVPFPSPLPSTFSAREPVKLYKRLEHTEDPISLSSLPPPPPQLLGKPFAEKAAAVHPGDNEGQEGPSLCPSSSFQRDTLLHPRGGDKSVMYRCSGHTEQPVSCKNRSLGQEVLLRHQLREAREAQAICSQAQEPSSGRRRRTHHLAASAVSE